METDALRKTIDIFISHASEDKNFVRSLAKKLYEYKLEIWYDENDLKLGDNFRPEIEKAISITRYAVVVCSRNYFSKSWPQQELEMLQNKEQHNDKIILPILHDFSHDDLKKHSPSLAGKTSVASTESMELIVNKILEAIGLSSTEKSNTNSKQEGSAAQKSYTEDKSDDEPDLEERIKSEIESELEYWPESSIGILKQAFTWNYRRLKKSNEKEKLKQLDSYQKTDKIRSILPDFMITMIKLNPDFLFQSLRDAAKVLSNHKEHNEACKGLDEIIGWLVQIYVNHQELKVLMAEQENKLLAIPVKEDVCLEVIMASIFKQSAQFKVNYQQRPVGIGVIHLDASELSFSQFNQEFLKKIYCKIYCDCADNVPEDLTVDLLNEYIRDYKYENNCVCYVSISDPDSNPLSAPDVLVKFKQAFSELEVVALGAKDNNSSRVFLMDEERFRVWIHKHHNAAL